MSISVLFASQCILLKRFDFIIQDNRRKSFHDSQDISCFHFRYGQIVSNGRKWDEQNFCHKSCVKK